MSAEETQPVVSEFDAKVEELVKFTPKSKPYLIFKKVQNPKSDTLPRNEPETVPFLFPLDGAHGTLLQVSIYERKGWPVIFSNIPAELIAKNENLLDIHRHLQTHVLYGKQAAEDTGKQDVKSKLAKKQAATKEVE